MTVKFDVKNVAILGKLQVAEGTPASPVATDALAVTNLTSDITRETTAYEYKGDSLSREEFTTLKDTFADVKAETLMPTVGTLNPALLAVDAPLYQWFTACNVNTTVDAAGAVTYSNNVEVNKLLTIDYFKSSPEVSVPGTAKRYRFTDCRGKVDVAFEAGGRATLAFNFMGNDSNPTMETNIAPDLGTQVEDTAAVVRLKNMQYSTIKEILGTQEILTVSNIVGADGGVTITTTTVHNSVVGETLQVSGTTNFNANYVVASVTNSTTIVCIAEVSPLIESFLVSSDGQNLTSSNGQVIVSTGNPVIAAETSGSATKVKGVPKNMCVNNGNFTNIFGFDYQRYLMTCQEGFSKKAVPTDISVTMLEDEVGGTDFDPEANIEKFFQLDIKWGEGTGKYITISIVKAQLVNSKDTTIASFFGKDVSFRNTGYTSITLS